MNESVDPPAQVPETFRPGTDRSGTGRSSPGTDRPSETPDSGGPKATDRRSPDEAAPEPAPDAALGSEPAFREKPVSREPAWLDLLAISLGTGMGVGLVPRAPGTFGSLLGPPLVIATQQLGLPLPVLSLVIGVFVLAGIPVCSRASRALGTHDPGQVVYDEIAAFWFVFLPQLVSGSPITGQHAIAGFLLFRVFDIGKPWPVSRLERLPGGIGIMADDLAAGLMAAACLAILPL